MQMKLEKLDRSRTVTFNDKKTGQPKTLPKLGAYDGSQWYGCFQADWNKDWNEGDTVEVEVEQRGNFWNIIPQRKATPETGMLKEILENQKIIINLLKPQEAPTSNGRPPDDDSVPF